VGYCIRRRNAFSNWLSKQRLPRSLETFATSAMIAARWIVSGPLAWLMDQSLVCLSSHPDIQPKENEVHIWRADLDLSVQTIQSLELLNEEERRRGRRFDFDRDRNRFTTARSFLRLILSQYLKSPPKMIAFSTGATGKPALTNHLSVRFNALHSDVLALYAFALDREVAVDVERVQSNPSGCEVVHNYFSKREQQECHLLSPEFREEAFYLGWTRNEVYLKARGQGLRARLSDFDVSLDPREPSALISDDAERSEVHSFRASAGFVGALVVEGRNSELRFWQWTRKSD
jgi:4'-phosphopantetheinyl transferase